MSIKMMELAASVAPADEASKLAAVLKKFGSVDQYETHVSAKLSLKVTYESVVRTFEKRGYKVEEVKGFVTRLVNSSWGVACQLSWYQVAGGKRNVTANFGPAKVRAERIAQVALNNLFLVQDNTDLDQKWIRKLAAAYKNGATPEVVAIVPLTPKVRADMVRIRQKNPDTADILTNALLATKKKAALIDGNHRYMAAKLAGLRSLPFSVDEARHRTAGDIVQMMREGYL